MLKLKKVWIADNGDIFLEREVDYIEATQKEIEELKNQALEALDRGEFEYCHYEEGKTSKNVLTSKYGKYYSKDGEFLGNEQIHVLTGYSASQEGMYLNYKGTLKPFWKDVKKVM